jgi:PAS domain S-box-containing protein
MLATDDRFRGLVESVPDAILIVNTMGEIEMVNTQAERLFGYAPGELLGRPVALLVPERFRARQLGPRGSYAEALVWPIGMATELYALRKDGNEFPIEISRGALDAGGETLVTAAIRDVTERRRAEEERVRIITETANEAFVKMDASGMIAGWSPEAEAIFGWPSQDVIGRPVADTIIPFKDREAHRQGLKRFLATGEGPILKRRLELTALHRDGHEFPVEINVSPRQVGDTYVFNAFLHDISERKRAEEALSQSEERFRGLVTASSDVVYRMSPDWSEMRYLRGQAFIPDTQSSNRTWLDKYIHPDDQPHVLATIRQAIRTKGMFELEHRVLRMDGSLGWTFSRAIPLMDDRGEIVEWVGTATDVTKRKEAEEALRESEERRRVALEAANFGTFNYYPQTGKLVWDTQMKRIWALQPDEELIYEEAIDRIHSEDRERVRQAMASSFAPEGNGRFRVEFRVVWPDGRVNWHGALGRVYFEEGPAGKRLPVRMTGVESDISERKGAEEALARANTELQQFAYVASHDLQEPLRAVAGFCQLLAEKYHEQIDAKGQEWLGYVVGGAKHMQELVQGLLRLSRVETEGKAFVTTPAADIVAQALHNLDTLIQESGAEIICGDLPSIHGDPWQLVTVFQNLIGNAIKFRSKEPPHIRVSAEPHGMEWKFQVRDNGIGIDPKHFGRLFVIFQRLHRRDVYPGTGIGLVLCRRIVERHGGRIWLQSESGKGSTFFFALPAAGGNCLETAKSAAVRKNGRNPAR